MLCRVDWVCFALGGTSETLRLPARVANALRSQARAAGMTLSQYLEQLSEGNVDCHDREVEGAPSTIEINDEMSAILERVEYQWLKPAAPKTIIEATLDRFDELWITLRKDLESTTKIFTQQLRPRLKHEFPEVAARAISNSRTSTGFTAWVGWLADVHSYKRSEKERANSIATQLSIGISNYTRNHALSIVGRRFKTANSN